MESAFSGCTSLASISLSNSVTHIGDYAFYGCKSLTEVLLPKNVASIGKNVFWECESLENIIVEVFAVDKTEIHDRTIITNYMWIGSGAGFDILRKNKNAKKSKYTCKNPE